MPLYVAGGGGSSGVVGQGFTGNWAANVAVVQNEMRLSPTGALIVSTASRTTRAAYDATEISFWTAALPQSSIFADDAGSLTATSTWAIGARPFYDHAVTLTANHAMTISGFTAGFQGTLLIRQDATGGRTFSINGVSVTINTAPNSASVLFLRSVDGTNLFVTSAATPSSGGTAGASTTRGRQNRSPAPRQNKTVFTTFQSGHAFTKVTTGAETMTDNTTDYAIPTQSFQIVTNGAGGAARADRTGITAIDLTNKNIYLTMKATAFTNVQQMLLYAGSDAGAWTNFGNTDLVSTQTTAQYANDGEWFTTSFAKEDMAITGTMNWATVQRFRISLTDKNATPITVQFQELDFGDKPANGCISLVFDDGFLGTYNYALPKMASLGFKGMVGVIADLIDGGTGSVYMSTDQLQKLQNLHGWDIASHAYTVANHNQANGFASLTDTQAEAEFEGIKGWLIDRGFKAYDHFMWPLGKFDTSKLLIAREHFTTTRSVAAIPPVETYHPADWHRLRTYLPSASTTNASITALVDRAVAKKGWLILTFHELVSGTAAGNQFSQTNFNTIMDYINSSGLPVRTISEVYARGVS